MQVYIDCVRAFHDKLNVSPDQPWNDGNMNEARAAGEHLLRIAKALEPDVAAGNIHSLRAHLMIEELGETLTAACEVDAFDGLCDLLYVLFGTALVYDWPLEQGFAEVHRSNMTKEKQIDDELSNRVRDKGEGYQPPSLEVILRAYREGRLQLRNRSLIGRAFDEIHNAFFKNAITVDEYLPSRERQLLRNAANACIENEELHELALAKLEEITQAWQATKE